MKTILDSVKNIEQIFGVLAKKIQRPDLIFITVEKKQVLSVSFGDDNSYRLS